MLDYQVVRRKHLNEATRKYRAVVDDFLSRMNKLDSELNTFADVEITKAEVTTMGDRHPCFIRAYNIKVNDD